MTVSVRRAIIQIIEDDPFGSKNTARWTPELGWHHPREHMELLAQWKQSAIETVST